MPSRTRNAALVVVALTSVVSASVTKAGVVATYQFQNTLAADQGGAPALTPVNSGSYVTDTVLGQPRTVYQRFSASNISANQSALRLDTAPLGLTSNNYAVEIVFTLTDNLSSDGYRRIVDSYDPASLADPGLYVGPGNTLNIFQGNPNSGGPALVNGTYYDVVLSVSLTSEQAYLNGVLAVNRVGTPDAIATHFLTFFQDEVTEYANGRVALIRVFDSALTANQVAVLNNNGNPFPSAVVPEPSTMVAGSFAVLCGLGLAWRRRQIA